MTDADAILAAVRRLESKVDAMSAPREALKRRDAAAAMGISLSKLEKLIARGKVRTASGDHHLVPMSEVRRYCAPKASRERSPAVGHRARLRNVDGQSDEAIDEMKRALRGGR